MSKATEKEIKAGVLGALESFGVMAWVNNPGGRNYTRKDGSRAYAPHGIKGQADITGILPDGRRLEIEVKRPGESPRSDQWTFLLAIQRSRGVAFWVDSARLVVDVMPPILGGAWVYTDPNLQQHVTDRQVTGPILPIERTKER